MSRPNVIDVAGTVEIGLEQVSSSGVSRAEMTYHVWVLVDIALIVSMY